MGKAKPGANAPSRVATPDEVALMTPEEIKRGSTEIKFPCGRCGGSGIFTNYHGQCYACNGTGKEWGRLYTPEKRAALDEARDKREQRKRDTAEEKRIEGMRTCVAQYPDAYKVMAEVMDDVAGHGVDAAVEKWSSFIVDVSRRGYNAPISEKQASSIVKAVEGRRRYIEKVAADRENASPVVEGKQKIVGDVLTTKYKSGPYGETLKMLVKDHRGFKVWGTVPKSIRDDIAVNLVVEFTATVEKSSDDETFGFFSRPTNAKVFL